MTPGSIRTDPQIIKKLLSHNLGGKLQFPRVSRAVNSTKERIDFATMIEPVNPL